MKELDFLLNNLKIPDEYIHPAIKTKDWEIITTWIEKNGVTLDLITFPLVTKKFCDNIISLAENKGEWTESRHKDYPTYDILLQNFGMGPIYKTILKTYVYPLVKFCWGLGWDDWKSEDFLAKYDLQNQEYLAVHNDEARWSCLVALNDNFEGGGTFYPRQNVEINLEPGYALVHPEINYRHGGRIITKGTRYIIISFINR